MIKLMKYEFRKQLNSKFIILFLLVLIQTCFLLGVFFENDDWVMSSSLTLFFLVIIVFSYLAFEAVGRYAKDLNEKCSYMLFLTPNDSYNILGAKILVTILQVVLFSVIFFALFIIDAKMFVNYFDFVDDIRAVVEMALDTFFVRNILDDYNFYTLVLGVIKTIADWLLFVVMAFFAITLSNTFLYSIKFKNFISLILYIIINTGITYLSDIMKETFKIYVIQDKLFFDSIFTLIAITVIYFVTAYMVEKKLSV